MDLWNIRDVKPPPVSSCKVTTKEIDIRLLEVVLKDGKEFFENQVLLHTEVAVLSRGVYRLKTKFRSSKDFKSVEKLNCILKRYEEMHISIMLKVLLDSIPANYKIDTTYMLTKNMIDYVLVRLQGLGKILSRILETCKTSTILLQQRLRIGNFWKIAVIILATISRIFIIAKDVLKYSCELYANLLPYSSNLSNSGVQWLPADYCFPNRLNDWLNIDWLDLENDVIEIIDDEPSFSYLQLADSDDDVQFCDEYILIDDTQVIDETQNIKLEELRNLDNAINDPGAISLQESTTDENNIIDIGEAINIEEEEPVKQTKRKKKRKSQKLENIASCKEAHHKAVHQNPKKRKKQAQRVIISDTSFVDIKQPNQRAKRIIRKRKQRS